MRDWSERASEMAIVGGAVLVVAYVCGRLRRERAPRWARLAPDALATPEWWQVPPRKEPLVKIKRDVPLSEALDGISAMVEQLRSSTLSVGDRQIQPADHVSYELEIESGDDGFEIEFEIKWRAPASDGSPQPQW